MGPNTILRAPKFLVMACCAMFCADIGISTALARAQVVTFDPAGSLDTYPWRANDDGCIAGFWYDSSEQVTKAFIRTPDGTITSFDHTDSRVTAAYGINNRE